MPNKTEISPQTVNIQATPTDPFVTDQHVHNNYAIDSNGQPDGHANAINNYSAVLDGVNYDVLDQSTLHTNGFEGHNSTTLSLGNDYVTTMTHNSLSAGGVANSVLHYKDSAGTNYVVHDNSSV